MSNPELSSRNAVTEASVEARPRTSMLKRSASNPALLSAEKLENLPEDLKGLPSSALKVHASLVMEGMAKLTSPDEAAQMGERLQQKFPASGKITEAGAIGYANGQITALVNELKGRPPQEAVATLEVMREVSEKYSNAVLNYPPNRLDDRTKLAALMLNVEVQHSYNDAIVVVKAKELSRSTESIAAEALAKAGPPPTPEIEAAFNKLSIQ